ncbi:MAG: glycosyltransferase [Gammaproteobacteria bacterium]|nr:glycosyltransferase [Gammaproteobacteria bacterium]MCP5424781.1 glycosyltransferase [Gammaproteobacteria bacterium]MCP5458242.1 glycosyltransferase [Gammaproteobacteria bacterium]
MKIVHIESGRHLYGGALQVLFLLQGLRERPGRHVLICPEDGAIAAATDGLVEKQYAIPWHGDLDFGLSRRLRAILRQERPDLVHIHSRRGADIWGGWAAWREGIPAILSRRVDNPEPRWLAPWKYRLYQRVVTISQGIRGVLLAEGLPPERVTCVPSAVDVERYRPAADRAWFRREFALAEEEPAVGMIAQFIERKGHRLLLEAMPAILRSHPRVRFLLFGAGALRDEMERLCAQRGWQERILFPGFRKDLERIIPCLNLVAHPATLEGLGVALLQAAACAVPIVASRTGGIPEIVHDEVNGLLVPPGDSPALARAVIRLLDDPVQSVAFGQAGRRIAVRDFSIAAMVEGNYRVYREVLEAGGSKRRPR